MPIQFGTDTISSIYYGSQKISKVYKGSTLVYDDSVVNRDSFVAVSHSDMNSSGQYTSEIFVSTNQDPYIQSLELLNYSYRYLDPIVSFNGELIAPLVDLNSASCELYSSTDGGLTWGTKVYGNPNLGDQPMQSLVTCNNILVGCAPGLHLYVSSDGTHWTPYYYTYYDYLLSASDRFFAVTGDETDTSTNGTDWSSISTPTFPISAKGFIDVAKGQSNYVAIDSVGSVFVSSDGLNWTYATGGKGSSRRNNCLAYGNGVFVTVNKSSNRICYSSNGYSWTDTTEISDNTTDILFDGEYFMAKNGSVMSSDGSTWTACRRGSPPSEYPIVRTAFIK